MIDSDFKPNHNTNLEHYLSDATENIVVLSNN